VLPSCFPRAPYSRTGNRIGSFGPEVEEEVSGVKLTCSGAAVSSRSPGLPVAATELHLTWRAPSLIDRARPGAQKVKPKGQKECLAVLCI